MNKFKKGIESKQGAQELRVLDENEIVAVSGGTDDSSSSGDDTEKKHVSNIKWTPGKATVGIGMGKG